MTYCSDNCWALVLAGGEGSRLRSLTTTMTGVAIPKQFCSLRGGDSLLYQALQRAEFVALREHVCAVVAARHQSWWQKLLNRLPPGNVVVQPGNCGTASGVLLPLMDIMASDADASIVILPSDHHVDSEAILARALREATHALERRPNDILLLGMQPDEPDPELGYIVPGLADADGTAAVLRFVEKPAAPAARELITEGALWNAFIIVARAGALLALFERSAPELVSAMRQARGISTQPTSPTSLQSLYRTMAPLDFSRHILPGQESHLRVIPVPACGWTDLGTPKRVALMLSRPCLGGPEAFDKIEDSGVLNLAVQYRRQQQGSEFAGLAVSASNG